MGRTFALLVGISNYSRGDTSNLPFAINDMNAIKTALILGLNISKDNIFTLGENKYVTRDELRSKIDSIDNICESEDSVIFYFSGHGDITNGQHYLVCSDILQSTQEIINHINSINAKSKILFLDACMSGNFSLSDLDGIDFSQGIENIIGEGCAVFASCSAEELSWYLPSKTVSAFTNNLCFALQSNSIIREGRKTLYDIKQLLFWVTTVFNKRNPDFTQTPIFREKMIGTITFKVADYTPRHLETYYVETDSYIISSIKPLHNISAKRYAVKVILKNSQSINDLVSANEKIVQQIKNIDLENAPHYDRWARKPANIIFCNYGMDEDDVINNNYYCRSIWVDNTQDKEWWYRQSQNGEIINDTYLIFNKFYNDIKQLHSEHTANRLKLIKVIRQNVTRAVKAAGQVIAFFNEYENNTINEAELIEQIAPCLRIISHSFIFDGNLEFPPNEIKKWSDASTGLLGTIYDFNNFYNAQYLSARTPETRKACMQMTIRTYYSDLEKVKSLESTISEFC